MLIRELKKEDLPQLAQLYRQFWNETSELEAMNRKFEQITAENHHILLVAQNGEAILTGSVTGIICEELYGGCRPFLVVENMIVDRRWRRKGVGRALFSELERQAKHRRCTQMLLVTERDRADACRFYESVRFQKNHMGFKKKLL